MRTWFRHNAPSDPNCLVHTLHPMVAMMAMQLGYVCNKHCEHGWEIIVKDKHGAGAPFLAKTMGVDALGRKI